MFRQVFILFFVTLILAAESCIVPADVVEKSPEETLTIQEKCELSVRSYLKRAYDSLGTYQSYSFGKAEEIIPDQVLQLEEFKEMRKLLPGMKETYGDKLDSVMVQYDSLIARKEREIIEKKVRSFWKIQHLFTVTLKSDSLLACEVNFTMDPNFKVYDAHNTIYLPMSAPEGKWFDFYYMQYPLFESWYNEESEMKRSQEIYDFYDRKMLQQSDNRSEVLKRILFIIRHIRTTGEFANQKVAEAIIRNELSLELGKTYQPGKFSELKAIIKNTGDGEQDLIGYSIVHTFNSVTENLQVEKAYYFEFDPWLILAGYLPAEPPYEQYFEK